MPNLKCSFTILVTLIVILRKMMHCKSELRRSCEATRCIYLGFLSFRFNPEKNKIFETTQQKL